MFIPRRSPVIRFRDSAKVLRAIQEIIDQHEEVVTRPMGKDLPIDDGHGLTVLSTLNLVKEVIEDAPTTTEIFKVGSQADGLGI